MLLLLLTGLIFLPGSASAQEDPTPRLTVLVDALNIRSGPAVHYPPFDTLEKGATAGIIGYNAESGWWQVVSRYGSPGWVSGGAAYVSVNEAALRQFIEPAPAPAVAPVTVPAGPGTLVFQTSSGGPIYAVNGDGTNLRYLTTGLDPVISPDGQQVVFARWETSQDGALGNLWLINVDGTGERVIMENVYNPRTPAWSPDGSQIVLSHQEGGRPDFEQRCSGSRPPRNNVIDIDVNRQSSGDIEFCYTLLPDPHWSLRVLTVATGQYDGLSGDIYSLSPAWDPVYSGRIVYDGEKGLVSLDLNQDKTFPFTVDINDHSPVYSPDGSKIAVSYRQDDHWEVHVLNADGSGRLRLTDISYIDLAQRLLEGQPIVSPNNAAPTWSPDGSRLAFLTDRRGPWEIWVMNADGSHPQPLVSAEMLAGIPLQYNGVDERVLSWR